MNLRVYFIEFSYLLASILFIFGLKGMSHPETAKRGMHLAEFGMLMAMLGTLTTTGSLLAFAKLQGMARGQPITYRGQNIFNMALLATTVGIFIYLIVFPGSMPLFFTMVALSFVF